MDHIDPNQTWGRASIQKSAADYREQGLSPTEALRKARQENPDDYQRWNGQPVNARYDEEIDESNFHEFGKAAFTSAVDELVRDYEVTPTEACRMVRKGLPETYLAMQGVHPDDIPDDINKATGRDVQELQLKAEGIKHAEGCSGTEAMRRARKRFPHLYAATQVTKADDLAGMPSRDTVVEDGEAKRNWLRHVANVQDRMARTSGQAVSFTSAMQAARKENPELFDAYQEVALPNPVLRGRSV